MARFRYMVLVAPLVVAIAATGCGSKTASSQQAHRMQPPAKDHDADTKQLRSKLGAIGTTAVRAGCIISTPEEGDAEHIGVGDYDPKIYSSDPPTSGPHFENWAAFGFYDRSFADGYVIHNLEHGGVALWYGDSVSEKTTATIRDDVLDDGEKWVALPRDEYDGIAVASWETLMTCPQTAVDTVETQDKLVGLLDTWYDVTHSTKTDSSQTNEKDIPAYAGAMTDPKPERDISVAPPAQ